MKATKRLLRSSQVAGLLIVMVIAFAPQAAYAYSCTSQQNGDWQTASTWTSCNGGTPGTSDSATVGSGHTVTMSNAGGWDAASVTVDSGSVLRTSNRFKVTSGSFNINGTLTILGGGYVDNTGQAPVYGSSSMLRYDTNGSYNFNQEWGSTQPHDV